MVRRVPHHWVLVAETAWDRQASVGSPLVFEAICGMIGCLEDAIFRGRGVLRDMTVVSPRAMFWAKAKHWVSGRPGLRDAHTLAKATGRQHVYDSLTLSHPPVSRRGPSMPAAFLRLFLVRHAEALANPDLRYLGSRDDPLTECGQWQARQRAHAFAPLALAAVYTSPLTRAVATAAPIAEAHGLSIIPDPRLVEAAMGTWEGLRRAEILARSADDAARHHQWEADPTCAPPGGESLAAGQARVVACVRDLAERHAGAAVVLVSHVGPIKALLCTALDVPLTTGQRLFLDNATVSVMDWGAHAVPWEAPAIVRLVNAHHHLGWTAAPWMPRTEAM